MALNFPDSPVDNQEYTVNNTVYTYDSAKGTWTATKEITVTDINEATVIAYSTVLGGW
jgi:hypothetical protein